MGLRSWTVMSVSPLALLCASLLLLLLLHAADSAAPPASTRCASYPDAARQDVCQQLHARLTANQPAGQQAQAQHASYRDHRAPIRNDAADHEHYDRDAPEEEEPGHYVEQREGSRSPYGQDDLLREQQGEQEDRHEPSHAYYPPPHAPTPDTPLSPSSAASLSISLAGRNLTASGSLTEADFDEWSIWATRRGTLNSTAGLKLQIEQYFRLPAGQLTVDGTVLDPTTVTASGNLAPAYGVIEVTHAAQGAADNGFPWQDTPAHPISIQLTGATCDYGFYSISDGACTFGKGVITASTSQVPFEGDAAELVIDALLGLPPAGQFEATCGAFQLNPCRAAGNETSSRANTTQPAPWRGGPRKLQPHGGAALLHHSFDNLVDSTRLAPGHSQPQQSLGFQGGRPASAGAATYPAPDHAPAVPSAPLYPIPASDIDNIADPNVVSITVAGNTNATGHLTQDSFDDVGVTLCRAGGAVNLCALVLRPQLGRRLTGAPVDLDFVGPAQQPTAVTLRTKLVTSDARVVSVYFEGFPWDATRAGYEVVALQPTRCKYVYQVPSGSGNPTTITLEGAVARIESPVAFRGSLTDLVVDALTPLPSDECELEVTCVFGSS